MTFQELHQFTNAEPFRPFRIQMASGRSFDIRHPENIRIGANTVYVFLFSQSDQRIVEQMVMLGYTLMESVEYIDAPVVQDQE